VAAKRSPKPAPAPPPPDFFTENFDFDVSVEVLSGVLYRTRGGSTYVPEGCRGCGKFDSAACLKAGSAASVDPARVRVEWGHTVDGQTVMSSRMLAALRKVRGVEIDAYPIGPGKRPTHWVVWPSQLFPAVPIAPQKKLLAPYPEDVAFLSHGPRCKVCGREEDITWNLRWVSIPVDVVLAGVPLEAEEVQVPVWLFNAKVAEVVRKYPHARLRLSGVENRPHADPPTKRARRRD
jgi:hypothetical protein